MKHPANMKHPATPAPSSRVFVVQETVLDLAKATQFGRLVALLPRHSHVSMSTQPVLRELRNKLKDFSDSDYLLPLGDPAAIVLCGLVAAENNNGRLKLLKWDGHQKSYYEVVVDVHDRPRDNN